MQATALYHSSRFGRWLIAAQLAVFMGASAAAAQQRLLIPEGTVLTVRTETVLNSQTAKVGDRFVTTVTAPVAIDGMVAIPRGSRIEGTVSLARAATSRESGVIGVDFTRLVLPTGRAFAIDGKLTSTDPAEREQIEAQGGARVVFIGGRTGFGTAVGALGSGATNDPAAAGVLGALGTLLSRGADVTVPASTPVAVQLESGLALNVTGATVTGNDPSVIHTSADMIRAAQQALRVRNYYRGPIDGRLTNETRRALFEFQIDNEMLATGNLDGLTAAELGLDTRGQGTVVALSPSAAATLRRNAQTLVGSWRDMISVLPSGQLSTRRTYHPAELELYFALSAFADNASLYDQMIRVSGSAAGITAASQALVHAARRVDAAMQALSTPARMVSGWRAIQMELSALDPSYR